MNRLEKLLKLLQEILEKQQSLEVIYGKDSKLFDGIGLSVIEMVFDEIGFRYNVKNEMNKLATTEMLKVVYLLMNKEITQDECIFELKNIKNKFIFLEEKRNKYKKDSIYTVKTEGGMYQAVQIKHYDTITVFICIFRERYKERPFQLDRKNLHPEFEYLPVPETTFLMWEPVLIE